jgi:transposase
MADPLIRTALKAARPTLAEIARESGVARHNLDAYQFNPTVSPPPRAKESVADYLERHAEHLRRLAAELRTPYQLPKGEA